jgi:methyl-accepting chemotaxis protein
VTQQNAALVEEAAAASASMQEQAANLSRAVSVFQVDGTAQAAAVVPAAAAPRAVLAAPAQRPAAPARRPAAPARKAVAKPAVKQGAKATAEADWEEF